MRSLNSYKKVLIAIIFYDYTYDDQRPKSLFHSNLSHAKLLLRLGRLMSAIPLSLLLWALLRILSIRYKVSIYVLKTFRPGFASTYLCMMEPLCRQLQHENNVRHIKILVDPGESLSNVLVNSYEPHFTLYLDDRKKFARLIAYLLPKPGLEKKFINTSDKFLKSWLYPPSKNYARIHNRVPSDLANMGICKHNFVLFVHPSMKYYRKRLPTELLDNVKNRFVDLATYSTAFGKIIGENLKIIRVGLEVDEMPVAFKSIPIIDYSGDARNEESEFWLYENCKFLLSVANGAFWFSRRFDRPTMITNNYVLPFGYFSTLCTPMTIRNSETGTLLPFGEMFKLKFIPNFLSDEFMNERHLELVPNSAATLANAVDELLDFSNGRRILKTEDLELVTRYNSILGSLNIPIVEKMTTPSISFLREYSDLL